IWDWIGGAGNMDDKIGTHTRVFSHVDLAAQSGSDIQARFRNQGDWELLGRATAFPVNAATGSLRVALSGIAATVPGFPVRVTGPGLDRSLNKTTPLADLMPGVYTIN